jgi:hypothetical protein
MYGRRATDRRSEYPHLNNMAYSQKIIDDVMKTPKSLGNQLGRWAIHLDFPVTKIAYALGVTRQTVYNWFNGSEVFVAYRHRVETLLTIMQSSNTADEAWRRICHEYNLKP